MLKTRLLVCALALIAAVMATEAFARLVLGLGTPPLSVADNAMGYFYRPIQDVRRFGHRVHINRYGMRSDDFAVPKGANEFRLLVIGDSVVHGGDLLDQSQIATSIAQRVLAKEMRVKVTVANISAGGWGLGNELAYLRTYGTFNADATIVVLSSHDATEEATYDPLDFNHPTERPYLALQEAIMRYLPRYVPLLQWRHSGPPMEPKDVSKEPLYEMAELLRLARMPTCIFQHPTEAELRNGYESGHAEILSVAKAARIPTHELKDEYGPAPWDLYRDDIHLSAKGQARLARVIVRAVQSGECAVPYLPDEFSKS